MQARDEEEAYGMLNVEWRLSMPGKKYEKRNWSCPRCAEYFKETTPTAMDTAGSAGQLAARAAATSFDALNLEVQQLKAEVEELKVEVEKWKELVHGHVAYKGAHVDELRNLKQEIGKLRAEVTAAQNALGLMLRRWPHGSSSSAAQPALASDGAARPQLRPRKKARLTPRWEAHSSGSRSDS